MARFGLSFKMEAATRTCPTLSGNAGWDLVFNASTRRLDTVEGNDAIPQTVSHYILTQLGEMDLHPEFGIDIFGIMTSSYPHTLMVNELKNLESKLNLKNFTCTMSADGRCAEINGTMEKV